VAADLVAGSNSNTLNGTSPDQAKGYLDDTDNRIENANLQKRREQLNKIGEAGRQQLDEIIEAGRQRMDEKKIKYHIAGYEFVLQDQIAQAAKLVLWGKALIDEAVKASPEASMAWCGICLILPLFTLSSDTEQDNRAGFTYVTGRIRFYVALEPLLLPKDQDSTVTVPEDLKETFEHSIVDLYQHILEYQCRSVLRFFRKRLRNLGRDLIQREDWKGMLSKVKALEETLDHDFRKINDSVLRGELEKLNESTKGSHEFMRGILSVAEEQRDIQRKQVYAIPTCTRRSSAPNTK
jgi:hypothetical protein